MVYHWKPCSHIRADATTAGIVMEELAKCGRLTAKNLLDESRPEGAPLHNEFEWDDATAAEEYRTSQARHIISCITVTNEESGVETRAFFNVSLCEPTYHPIETLLQSADGKDALFKTALKELAAFQRKYASLTQLETIFEEIGRLSA